MPVPTVITDLSTTAASNSPAGSDAPGPDGDNYFRAHAAFIAQLYAGKTAVAAGMLKSDGSAIAVGVAGTDYLAPAAIGTTVQAYDADIATVSGTAAEIVTGTETAKRSWAPDVLNAAISAVAGGQSVISYTGTGGITAEGATLSTNTNIIPQDNTKPQITEGNALLDVTITPSATGAVIEVEAYVCCSDDASGSTATIALFRDSGADALRVDSRFISGAGEVVGLHVLYRYTAPNTNAITFKIRGSGEASRTIYWNAFSATISWGGLMASYIKATEVQT